MIGILSVFAQLEREQIKERMAMGREGRAKQGKWHGGGNVPIGYDFINDYLIPNEYEAAQVKQIFDLAIRGYSYSDIARSMSGYTTKYGPYNLMKFRKRLPRSLNTTKKNIPGTTVSIFSLGYADVLPVGPHILLIM